MKRFFPPVAGRDRLRYTGRVTAELPCEELRWRFLAPTRRT
jgi:hypothetical protein